MNPPFDATTPDHASDIAGDYDDHCPIAVEKEAPIGWSKTRGCALIMLAGAMIGTLLGTAAFLFVAACIYI